MFFTLDTPDPPQTHESWLLYDRDPAGRPRVRDVYRRLACRRCGRVDEPTALTAGVPADFRPPPGGRDAASTADYHLVVTQRGARRPARGPGSRSPRVPGAGVPWPLGAVPGPTDPTADRRPAVHPGRAGRARGRVPGPGPACAACGRPRQVTLRPEWLEVPADVVLAGAMVEVGWPGVAVTWVGSEAVADAVRRVGLTGWTLRPVRAGRK